MLLYIGISKNPFMSQINEPINPITRATYILVSEELQAHSNLLLVIKSNLVIYLNLVLFEVHSWFKPCLNKNNLSWITNQLELLISKISGLAFIYIIIIMKRCIEDNMKDLKLENMLVTPFNFLSDVDHHKIV